jgi:hypothetical protein
MVKSKLLLVGLFCFTLFIYGCFRSSQKEDTCKYFEESYYLPDTLYKWYDNAVPRGSERVNYMAKSSSGLSETLIVFKEDSGYEKSICYLKNYFTTGLSYRSTLYSNNMIIRLGFRTNYYPNGFKPLDFNTYTDFVDFRIIFGYSGYDVSLIQPISPKYHNQLKAAYVTYTKLPAVTQFLTCDTCIEEIGTYLEGIHTYNNVFRYKNPLMFGDSNSIKEFLIDRKYGIIKVTRKNNVNWTIAPF